MGCIGAVIAGAEEAIPGPRTADAERGPGAGPTRCKGAGTGRAAVDAGDVRVLAGEEEGPEALGLARFSAARRISSLYHC